MAQLNGGQTIAEFWRELEALRAYKKAVGGITRVRAAALFEFLKHGDEEHQTWLKAAIGDFFDGKPRQLDGEELSTPLERTNSDLKSCLGGFVEYFAAIERGDYAKNGRAPRIRVFERILIDEGRKLLGWAPSCLGVEGEGG